MIYSIEKKMRKNKASCTCNPHKCTTLSWCARGLLARMSTIGSFVHLILQVLCLCQDYLENHLWNTILFKIIQFIVLQDHQNLVRLWHIWRIQEPNQWYIRWNICTFKNACVMTSKHSGSCTHTPTHIHTPTVRLVFI